MIIHLENVNLNTDKSKKAFILQLLCMLSKRSIKKTVHF